MRDCPGWFQAELTRIGGLNPYGDPIFKLVWSTEPRKVIGGRWAKDGFEGYREVPAVHGAPCWALMVWEPRETAGSYIRWERDYRDDETGYLQCGGYPKYGHYRLMRRFHHIELVRQAQERHYWLDGKPHIEVIANREVREYRMEPCGLILDLMLPMLMAWRRLSDRAKLAAIKQEEALRQEEALKAAKDAWEGVKLSRVMRGSQLIQKRAERIEKGMAEAMKIAAQSGLGMRIG